MADALLFGNLFAERKERVYTERIEMADMSETQIVFDVKQLYSFQTY